MPALDFEALLAKVEGTYGSEPTPVGGTDDVVLAEKSWTNIKLEDNWPNLRDEVVVGAGGSLLPTTPTIPRGRKATITFTIEPRPKGSAYVAVGDLRGLTALYRACGLSATLSASGIDFTQVSSSLESCTVWVYAGGQVYKVNGCRGKCRLVAQAGQPLQVVFELQGFMRTIPATASVPSITYLTNPAPSVVSSALTIGPWSPDFDSFELDFGQDVVMRTSGNAADGIARFDIRRHRPRFKISAESVPLATYDPHADSLARTVRTIACAIGSGAGLAIKLTGLSGYVALPDHADLSGFSAWNLEYIVTALTTHRYD